MKKIIFFILTLFLFSNISLAQDVAINNYNDQNDSNIKNDFQYAQSLSNVFKYVAKNITPSIVNIKSTKKIKRSSTKQFMIDPRMQHFFDFFDKDFFDNLDENATPEIQQGSGTGVIIDKDGHIITNNHVIDEADTIEVKLSNDEVYQAKIIGQDPNSDLAVLKIDAKDLAPAKLGDSDKVEIGEWVIAGGNPFGLDNTITTGIVSARGRTLSGGSKYEDYIQTDAAINPGNSGGPLVNLKSEVIGINTAIFSKNGGYMGIGFAIPSNMVRSIVDSLITTGKVIRGWLGIGIQDLSQNLSKSFGYTGTKGALVSYIEKDSPAEKGGVKQGDIIMKINNVEIKDSNHLKNIVAENKPKNKVTLTIFRDKKQLNVDVKLGELKGDKETLSNQSDKDKDILLEKLGISLEKLNDDNKSLFKFKNEKGLVITKVTPGSIAQIAGLSRGELIVNVNGKVIDNIKDFEVIVNNELKNGIRLLIEDSKMEHFVFLQSN